MAGMRFREAGFFIDRLYSHFSHEGADMASAYLVALVHWESQRLQTALPRR
jgi:hypothetical protein